MLKKTHIGMYHCFFETTEINFFITPARGIEGNVEEINRTSILLFLAARNKSFLVHTYMI